MPIYEYRCPTERTVFSSRRSMAEMDAPIACPSCGAPSQRVLSIVAPVGRGEREPVAAGAPAANGGCCGGACGCGAR
ncbi:MAG: zinc ribbon domain-containing protein [Chloroflexi bacterium]|nr:zinc ribbon domain-containing protein [Chloroflexota bacterium]